MASCSYSHRDRDDEVTVKIRGAGESKIFIRAKLNTSVRDFKSIVSRECGVSAKRLIHKGREMKDNQTLSCYGLEDNQTVYVVRGSAPEDPILDSGLDILREGLRKIVDDAILVRYMFYIPVIRDLFNDPQSVCNMLMRTQDLSDILAHNPEVAFILNDPTTLRTILDAALDFNIMHGMIREAMDEARRVESAEAELRELSEKLEQALLRHETTINTNPLPNSYSTNWNSSQITPNFRSLGHFAAGRTHRSFAPVANLILNNMANPLPNSYASNEYMECPMVEETIHRMHHMPKYLIEFFGVNARLKDVFDSNPLIRYVMQNAEFIRRLSTPQIVNAILVCQKSLFDQACAEDRKRSDGWTGEGEVTSVGTLEKLIDMFLDLATHAGVIPQTASATPQAVGRTAGVLDLEGLPVSILAITNSSGFPESPMVDEAIQHMLRNPRFLIQFFGFTPRLRSVLASNPRIRNVMLNSEFSQQLATRPVVNALLIYHNVLNTEAFIDEIAGRDQISAGVTLQRLIYLFGNLAICAGMLPTFPRRPGCEYQHQYGTQLARLQEMGFSDTLQNILALIVAAGNLQLAVECLQHIRG